MKPGRRDEARKARRSSEPCGVHYAAAPVGAAVLTWAAEEQGTAPVALAAGATCVLLAATALLTPLRRAGRP